MWYPVKLLFVAWLALPQFKGASFIYDKVVREQLRKYRGRNRNADADHKVHILKVTNEHQCALPGRPEFLLFLMSCWGK